MAQLDTRKRPDSSISSSPCAFQSSRITMVSDDESERRLQLPSFSQLIAEGVVRTFERPASESSLATQEISQIPTHAQDPSPDRSNPRGPPVASSRSRDCRRIEARANRSAPRTDRNNHGPSSQNEVGNVVSEGAAQQIMQHSREYQAPDSLMQNQVRMSRSRRMTDPQVDNLVHAQGLNTPGPYANPTCARPGNPAAVHSVRQTLNPEMGPPSSQAPNMTTNWNRQRLPDQPGAISDERIGIQAPVVSNFVTRPVNSTIISPQEMGNQSYGQLGRAGSPTYPVRYVPTEARSARAATPRNYNRQSFTPYIPEVVPGESSAFQVPLQGRRTRRARNVIQTERRSYVPADPFSNPDFMTAGEHIHGEMEKSHLNPWPNSPDSLRKQIPRHAGHGGVPHGRTLMSRHEAGENDGNDDDDDANEHGDVGRRKFDVRRPVGWVDARGRGVVERFPGQRPRVSSGVQATYFPVFETGHMGSTGNTDGPTIPAGASRAPVASVNPEISGGNSHRLPTEKEVGGRKNVSKRYRCPHCDGTFDRIGHCITHIDSVHFGLRKYICRFCGKGYGHGSSLKRHGPCKKKKF